MVLCHVVDEKVKVIKIQKNPNISSSEPKPNLNLTFDLSTINFVDRKLINFSQ